MHTYIPLFWISFPFRSQQSTVFPVLYSRFSLFICFIHSIVYVSDPISQFILLLLLSSVSRVWLCVTPWTVAHQAPLSIKSPRHEYWSRFPCPPPGDLPNPGIEPRAYCVAGRFFIIWASREAPNLLYPYLKGFAQQRKL